jgi:hypothetical protein
MRRATAFLLAAAALATPRSGRAEPTVACHCFQNRTFDPTDPAAADRYILATTRSSLLSGSFGTPKASLVRAVMSGTAPEDLWVANWAAARTGMSPVWLLSARDETRSWKAALAGTKGLGAPFEAALARGASSTELAALAVDDVLTARLGVDPAAVRSLREAGATSELVIIATFLSGRLRQPGTELLARTASGKATWGTLLRDAGLAPAEIDATIRKSLR